MNTEPKPAAPSYADTERYDEAVRSMFPAPKEEMQRHEDVWKGMRGKMANPKTKKTGLREESLNCLMTKRLSRGASD